MSKKRVYELAKELGLENRELISRLEKIGIAVKSHSSTLEDGDLERIQAELLAPEAREVVEKRIKSTVIRRRAVRMPVEESKPEEAAAEPQRRKSPRPSTPPRAEAAPVEPVVPETAPKEAPVRTSIYRECACQASPFESPRRPRSRLPQAPASCRRGGPKPAAAPVEPEAKTAAADTGSPGDGAEGEACEEAGSRNRSEGPEPERKPLSVQPPPIREMKRPPLEQEKKPQTPPEAPRPAPGGRKEFPRRAGSEDRQGCREAPFLFLPVRKSPAGSRKRRNRGRKGQSRPLRF